MKIKRKSRKIICIIQDLSLKVDICFVVQEISICHEIQKYIIWNCNAYEGTIRLFNDLYSLTLYSRSNEMHNGYYADKF
jgi:hypothetical protein